MTVIEVDCRISDVWETLGDVKSWQSWWSWSRSIQVLREADDDNGEGAVYRNVVGTPFRYRLNYVAEVTNVTPRRRIDLLSTGDVEGQGRFLLMPSTKTGSVLHFHWLVSTTKWWMNAVAPLARPIFAWNHDRLMTDFANGLGTGCGASQVVVVNRSIAPEDEAFGTIPETLGN